MMTNIKRMMRVLALTMLVVAGSVAQAGAALITISPATQTVPLGPVSVDILVGGLTLTEAVGGFSLILSFDNTILSGSSYTNDPDSKMGVGTEFSGGFGAWGPGTLDLFYIAQDFAPLGPGLEDDVALKLLQGAGFRLATVNFSAIANGLSALTLSFVVPGGTFLSDAQGGVLQAQASNGQVCVGAACPVGVPEPTTISLLGIGLGALVLRPRDRRRSRA